MCSRAELLQCMGCIFVSMGLLLCILGAVDNSNFLCKGKVVDIQLFNVTVICLNSLKVTCIKNKDLPLLDNLSAVNNLNITVYGTIDHCSMKEEISANWTLVTTGLCMNTIGILLACLPSCVLRRRK